MLRHVGTEEEWDQMICQFDYQMPRTVFEYLGEKTTSKARLIVAKVSGYIYI